MAAATELGLDWVAGELGESGETVYLGTSAIVLLLLLLLACGGEGGRNVELVAGGLAMASSKGLVLLIATFTE